MVQWLVLSCVKSISNAMDFNFDMVKTLLFIPCVGILPAMWVKCDLVSVRIVPGNEHAIHHYYEFCHQTPK